MGNTKLKKFNQKVKIYCKNIKWNGKVVDH